jgi:hypothetical protein
MRLVRRFATVVASVSLVAALAGCGDDEGTDPAPNPVIGVSATATGSGTIRVTFSGRAGESYEIERGAGAGGTFGVVHTIPALSAAGTQTFDDAGLTPQTLYRYRVTAVRGSQRSSPSAEASGTTFALGSFSADITGDIIASRTLYADTTYTLKGFIHVLNGQTLTIQAGTKIVGDFNTPGSSLFIMRGARIQAVGTAALPIVFTSSRAAGVRQPGDWGGLIIVGNAPINRTGSIQLEGTGTVVGGGSGENYPVTYNGGSVPTDNSGTLSYVRVEFAGFAPNPNQELNTFTFAAVGSGTRASYLQAVAGLDDSFEFFGGGFDIDHIVAYESGDDMFDMSEGFVGRIQYVIGMNTVRLSPRADLPGGPASDPQGIENDGCDGAGCTDGRNSLPLNVPIVANFTLIGTNDVALSGTSGGIGMMLRRGTGGYYVNGVVARFPRFGASIRDAETYVRAGSVAIPNLATADLAVRNVLFAGVGAVFEPASGSQNVFDLAGNALVSSAADAGTLFLGLPAAGTAPTTATLDWTPSAGSPIASGGLAAFTGKLAAQAGTFVTGTAYLGAAAPGGPKWWEGWTVYARN